MRRRKRNGGTHAQQFLKDDLTARVNNLMDNRRRLLAPFPVDALAVYNAGWTDIERDAIGVLRRRNENLLRTGKTVKLVFRNNDRDWHIMVMLPEECVMPAYLFTLALKDLPMELRRPIVEWIPQWYSLHQEQRSLLSKITECAEVCKTYGQLYRMWPDILSFFDDDGKWKIDSARVRSAYPEDAFGCEHLDDGGRRLYLRAEYTPEAFAPFTSMIAECLMLPFKDSVEVAKVHAGG